jgi:hypothetical protein
MNFFIVGDAIFEVEEDGILDIFQCFFIGVTLGVTSLKLRAGGKVAIFVLFEQDGKKESAHQFCGDRMIIFYDFFCRLALAGASVTLVDLIFFGSPRIAVVEINSTLELGFEDGISSSSTLDARATTGDLVEPLFLCYIGVVGLSWA